MHFVFPALKQAFHADALLLRHGRWLFQGDEDGIRDVLPYVEVVCKDVDHTLDTFNAQQPVYMINWFVYTSEPQGDACAEIMEDLQRVYHDQSLQSSHFNVSAMEFTRQSGPLLVDAVNRGTLEMRLHIWRPNRLAETKAGVHG